MPAADKPIEDVPASARAFVVSRPFGAAPRHAPARAFVLSAALAARLAQYCQASGERPNDFVADAVALWLDEIEGPADV